MKLLRFPSLIAETRASGDMRADGGRAEEGEAEVLTDEFNPRRGVSPQQGHSDVTQVSVGDVRRNIQSLHRRSGVLIGRRHFKADLNGIKSSLCL